MKKGQLFIITAVLIGFVISGIMTIVPPLQLETRASYIETSGTLTMKRNVEKEMIKVSEMDPYNEENLLGTARLNLEKFAETKGMELDITWTVEQSIEDIEGVESVDDCDVDLEKSMTPLNKSGDGREFDITVHDPGEIKFDSSIIVCWE